MKIKRKHKEAISTVLKILLGLVYATPAILCVIFSFQTNSEINTIPNHLIPEHPTIQNYIYVLKNIPVFTYLKNTVVMIVIILPVQLAISATSAFAFSFFDFKGKNLLFTIFITTMMIPGETTLIARFMMIRSMGLMNTYLGLTIVSFAEAGGIFMLRQNMLSLPKELWEASVIDGCAEMRYFVKVALPLCAPLLSCQAIVSFIGIFNSYIWPMMVSSKDEFYTIQVGMAHLMGEAGNTMGYVLAGAVLCMLIPLLIYIFLQKQVVTGMTAGAIKN